jgi:hypothetical protein
MKDSILQYCLVSKSQAERLLHFSSRKAPINTKCTKRHFNLALNKQMPLATKQYTFGLWTCGGLIKETAEQKVENKDIWWALTAGTARCPGRAEWNETSILFYRTNYASFFVYCILICFTLYKKFLISGLYLYGGTSPIIKCRYTNSTRKDVEIYAQGVTRRRHRKKTCRSCCTSPIGEPLRLVSACVRPDKTSKGTHTEFPALKGMLRF